MRIVIETIDHKEQRYPTCGDWEESCGALAVSVSDVGDWRMEALVGIHELIEAVLCIDAGISQESVDEFDIAFEKAKASESSSDSDFVDFLVLQDEFGHPEVEVDAIQEPGDHPAAPYHIQHGYATAAERMLCAAMNIPWATYEARLKELDG